MDRNTKLTARNGRELDALVVFSYSIRYLKDRAIEVIREVTGDEGYSAVDMRWVITVPAIWKPAAKQFMREAAYQVNTSFNFPILFFFEEIGRVGLGEGVELKMEAAITIFGS